MRTDETLMKSSLSFSCMCIGFQYLIRIYRTSLRRFLSEMQIFVQFTLTKTKEDIFNCVIAYSQNLNFCMKTFVNTV